MNTAKQVARDHAILDNHPFAAPFQGVVSPAKPEVSPWTVNLMRRCADLCIALMLQGAVSDDITVAVTDILPSHSTSWPQTVRALRRQNSTAWLPACLAAPATRYFLCALQSLSNLCKVSRLACLICVPFAESTLLEWLPWHLSVYQSTIDAVNLQLYWRGSDCNIPKHRSLHVGLYH